MKRCIDCKHFTDGRYSKVYISPQCNQRGQDSAAYMRQYVCGVDEARLYQPRPETREGTEHAQQFNN
jgi:hypothetical protein